MREIYWKSMIQVRWRRWAKNTTRVDNDIAILATRCYQIAITLTHLLSLALHNVRRTLRRTLARTAIVYMYMYIYVRTNSSVLRYTTDNSVIFFLGRCTSYRNWYEARHNERQCNVKSTSAKTGAVNSWLGLGYLVGVTLRESEEFCLSLLDTC